jgi:hypothetical protein
VEATKLQELLKEALVGAMLLLGFVHKVGL